MPTLSLSLTHAASTRYPILDVDEPLCHLGLPRLLRVFLVLLGRSHLASTFSPFRGAFLGECSALALRGCGCSIPLLGEENSCRFVCDQDSGPFLSCKTRQAIAHDKY